MGFGLTVPLDSCWNAVSTISLNCHWVSYFLYTANFVLFLFSLNFLVYRPFPHNCILTNAPWHILPGTQHDVSEHHQPLCTLLAEQSAPCHPWDHISSLLLVLQRWIIIISMIPFCNRQRPGPRPTDSCINIDQRKLQSFSSACFHSSGPGVPSDATYLESVHQWLNSSSSTFKLSLC